MARVSFEKIGRSFAAGALAEVWRIGSRFIITPIILGAVGLSGYGVWTLLFSLAEYVSIGNVGIGVAYNKYTAECVRRGEYERLQGIIGAGIAGIGSVAVVGIIAAWFFGEPLLRAVNVPEAMVADAHLAMMGVMAVVVGRLTLGCSYEILAGLQRIDLYHKLSMLASVVEFAITVPLLLLDFGIIGMAVGYAAGQLSCFSLGLRWVKREDPQVRISPLLATRAGMREMLALGGRMQGLAVVNVGVAEGVKVLLSVMIDPRATALYELADKLVQLTRAPVIAIIGPLLAAFADLRAGGERARELDLLRRGWKAVMIVSCSVGAFLAIVAAPALLAWTGQDVPKAAWALQWMALAAVFNNQTGVPSIHLRAQGNVRIEFLFSMVSTAVGVAVILSVVAYAPFESVVYGRVAAYSVGAIWYIRAFLRHCGMDVGEWWRGAAAARVLTAVGASGAVVFVARSAVGLPSFGVTPRVHAVIEVVTWAALYFGMLVPAVWRFVLDPDERARLVAMVGRRVARLRGGGTPK